MYFYSDVNEREIEKMHISVILPIYNDIERIGDVLKFLTNNDPQNLVREILVIDGGSADNSRGVVEKEGIVFHSLPGKSRAAQMNYGAERAKGDILYFLHPGSFPPASYTEDIHKSVQNGFQSGCFQLDFDHDHWFLKLNSWFAKFDINAVRFGDQSLFVTREAFNFAGGFNEKLLIMEDQEIISRIKRYARFMILDNKVTLSASKHLGKGIFKRQALFFIIWLCYQLGIPQESLSRLYRNLFNGSRL